jgi:hypothetical protein
MDLQPANKKKLAGWSGVAAARRTRKAAARASRPACDPSKRGRTNPKMTNPIRSNLADLFPPQHVI